MITSYNCHRMPAICQNVRNWHNDFTKSKWPNRWEGWFTYDVGSGEHITNRGNVRREGQCPDTWKGTIASPRCPEPNQPPVVPPIFDANGLGVTRLAPQPPGATEVDLMIDDGRDNPLVGALQPSGRRYSCDEFPPASWIEGGIGYSGVVPEGSGGPGTTFCAPIGARCDFYDVRGSEQNWQGLVHSYLGRQLELSSEAEGLTVTRDTGIAFRFEYPTEQNEAWAARVAWTEGTRRFDAVTPGTHWKRGNDQPARVSTEFHATGNGSVFIALPNGEVFRGNDHKTARRAAKRAVDLSSGMNLDESSLQEGGGIGNSQNNTIKVPDW